MINNYYQAHKERLPKESRERLEKDIKILLKKKKKKNINIIKNIKISYLTIEDIIV